MDGSNQTRGQSQRQTEPNGECPEQGPKSQAGTARPLSFAQERIFRLSQSNPQLPLQTRVRMRLRGVLNTSALRRALDRVLERHEILRTRFGSEDGVLAQRVISPDAGFSLQEGVGSAAESMDGRADTDAQGIFDLARGPLIRARLVQTGELEHVLVIALHAIVADTWSAGVLIRELVALYNAFCLGKADPLPPIARQFADFASLEREEMSGERRRWRREYWVRALAGMPERLRLPGKVSAHERLGSATDRMPVRVPPELYADLQALAHRKETPLFVPLLCGWAVLLGRWAGQGDVVIGARMPNRLSAERERLIGPIETLVPLRVRFEHDTTVDQLLKEVKTTLRKGRSHQDVSFEQVMEDLSPSPDESPVLQFLMNVNGTPGEVSCCREMILHELQICEADVDSLNRSFAMALTIDEGSDGLTGVLEYDRDLFDRETIARLLSGWITLLEEVVADIHQRVSRLPVMDEAARKLVLVDFNETEEAFPGYRLIHQLFETQAEERPEAVAVEHEGRWLTYGQLNRRANQLARYLLSQGVGPDQVVGICVERSLEMLVGLLAILKAGGAYLPLDPNYPRERLQQMLEDAAPQAVLSETELLGVLPTSQARAISLNEKLGEVAGFIGENLPPQKLGLSSESLVYVIYTSGSTGRPKGTAMRHGSVVNLIEWHRRSFGQGRRVLQFAALSFDVAFQEIFSTLCTGGTLVLLDEWIRRDAKALAKLLIRGSIERLFVPPLMLQSIAEHCKGAEAVPGSLRDVITAGEQLRISAEVRELFGRLAGCRLHNHYGPTETHVVTALTLEGDPGQWPELPPIGRPIANTQIYVLDDRMQPVPIAVPGELYIGGANVAKGYLNRPELTEQRFVVDPYSAASDARLYKTGDLGRWRADGVLEYLGRNDDQVKIRGFRVELGEIEAQLARHERVKEAAVVVREDAPGEKRLVAYVTACGDDIPSVENLRTHLLGLLPEYMLPSAFVLLEELPLTPSGKLDRRALPAPDLCAHVTREYDAPRGEVEEALAVIWQDLLKIARVGRNDNLFELGGNSYLVVQMMERLRELGLSADIRCVFQSQSLADLAMRLDHSVSIAAIPENNVPVCCSRITPEMLPLIDLTVEQIDKIVRSVPGGAANVQDIYPLAVLQEGILFHHLMNEHKADTYVLPVLLEIPSPDRIEDLIVSIQRVIDRHDILRTAVLWDGLPTPVQVVQRKATLKVVEHELDAKLSIHDQLQQMLLPERQQLEIDQAPMMRLQLLSARRDGPQYAVLQLHHMTCDHESLEAILLEVKAHMEGRVAELPPVEPYRNFIARVMLQARSSDGQAFFRAQLADVDEPTAPFDFGGGQADPSGIEYLQSKVPSPLAARIRARARQRGISPAALFHSAWALVLSVTTGRDDVVFGTVLLGRMQDRIDARRMLGPFMNTLPLRLRLKGLTVAQLSDLTQSSLVDILEYEQVSLATAQRCSGVSGSAPLFTTLLNYRYSTAAAVTEAGAVSIPKAESIRVMEMREWTNYPLTVSIDDLGDSFLLTIKASYHIGADRIMVYMTNAIESLVGYLESAPETLATSVSVLSKSELREILASAGTSMGAPSERRVIHELFEERVAKTPDAIAVSMYGESMSFRTLNIRANKFAWHLRERGVGPDTTVGICMKRSLDLIVGLIGILKAGGAYVPLDPDYPVERLRYFIADSSPLIIVTDELSRARLPAECRNVICVEEEWNEISRRPSTNVDAKEIGVSGAHLAYVIYTSGSTGRPKGVMVEHRNVVSLWQALECIYQENVCHRVAMNASISFDASVKQIIQLLSGRTVVVIPQELRLDPFQLISYLKSSNVHCIDCTPSQLQSWISAGVTHDDTLPLKVVLVGGEAINQGLWDKMRASPSIEFYNVYGPTECTVDAAMARVKGAGSCPTIGSPMDHAWIYILDQVGRPAPVGVRGEICIGGAGVSRGYLNGADATGERFVADTLSGVAGSRIYRTGDVGRWQPGGTIEYLGRSDRQIKVRGHRVELGEVEAHIRACPGVKDVAVVLRENSSVNGLVAYLVCGDAPACKLPDLRGRLQAELPAFMVPSAFVIVGALPLTPSGKLNHEALPSPVVEASQAPGVDPPRGRMEQAVAEVWCEVLGLKRAARDDDFFDLGGNSVVAMQAIVRLRTRTSMPLSVRTLFEYPSIRGLAARIIELKKEWLREQLSLGRDKNWR